MIGVGVHIMQAARLAFREGGEDFHSLLTANGYTSEAADCWTTSFLKLQTSPYTFQATNFRELAEADGYGSEAIGCFNEQIKEFI